MNWPLKAAIRLSTIASLALISLVGMVPAQAQEVLGVLLPAPLLDTVTGGGAPNFADTWVTPFVATQPGVISTWKAQFEGGFLANGGPGVPAGIQIKVLRRNPSDPNLLTVVSEGAIHDPRPLILARFGAFVGWQTQDAVFQFSDPGLFLQPGDIIGLTLESDPSVGAYFYPFTASSATGPCGTGVSCLVTRNVGVGGSINLADIFTGRLPFVPDLQVNALPTFSGLCALTHQVVSKPGVADSLCAKLSAAQAAAERGNGNAKAGALGAYIDEVSAQRDKSITPDNAALLIEIAGELLSEPPVRG
jgi:hypothetical protein